MILDAAQDLPIANVKKAKPNMTPTYPKAGNIHML
jgi:hypothetical protein